MRTILEILFFFFRVDSDFEKLILARSAPSTCPFVESGLTVEQQNLIVAEHNRLRAEKPTPKPFTPLPKIKWDKTLASMAQKYVDKC